MIETVKYPQSAHMAMTLEFYDSDPEAYSRKTFDADMSGLRAHFTCRLSPGSRILDLGCGSGRDSLAFMRMGYDVVPADGSEGMCRVAESNIGIPVRRMLFSEMDYADEFDGVWACASLLHACSADLPSIFAAVHRALRRDGVFFCCFKYGDFEGVRDGRHYTDMTESSLGNLLESSGFRTEEIWTSDNGGFHWVNAVSTRIGQ